METYLQTLGFSNVQSVTLSDHLNAFHSAYRIQHSSQHFFLKVYSDANAKGKVCFEREQFSCQVLGNTWILPVTHQWQHQVNGTLFYFLCFQGFTRTLKEEVKELHAFQSFWTEERLWEFVRAMLWTGKEMQDRKITHREIMLKNVVKDASSQYRLTGFHFSKTIASQENLMESYMGGILSEDEYFLRDVFDMGLMFLQLAALQPSIPEDFIPQNCILRLIHYSEALRNLLLLMLQPKRESRPSFTQLCTQWPPQMPRINCDHYPNAQLAFVQTRCHGFRCNLCVVLSSDREKFKCFCNEEWLPFAESIPKLHLEDSVPCLCCGRMVREGDGVLLQCGKRPTTETRSKNEAFRPSIAHCFCTASCFQLFIQTRSCNFSNFSLVKCPLDSTEIPFSLIQSSFGGREQLQSAISSRPQSCVECLGKEKLIKLPCGHSLCKPCGSFYAKYYDLDDVTCPADGSKLDKTVVMSFLSPMMRFTYKFLGIN